MLGKRSKDEFSHGRVLGIAGITALVLHLVAFGIWPEYVPTVYKLPEQMIVGPLPPETRIPPEPTDIPKPEMPEDALLDDEVDEDATIAPNSPDFIDLPPILPRPAVEPEPVFVPFDKKPVTLHLESPEYPEFARQAQLQGSVKVRVTIDERGRVIDAQVVETAAEFFNEAAIEAAYKCRFKPAYQRDVPVRCRIVIPFLFKLRS